jgi:hypothetical protein
MAVDADTYGTIARLQALIGDVVSGRVFADGGSATTPSLTDAEAFLDDTAGELNTLLTQSEYAVPVVVGTDKAAFNYLRYVNTCGAAALVLDALPAESYSAPGMEVPASGRKQHFQNIYLAALKLIKDEKLSATRISDGSHLGPLKIGSQKNSDGNTKNPIFIRGRTDYPGSRSLITE